MQPEEVIAKVFGMPPTEVTDDTSNKTVSTWDSYGHLTLILELEATYRLSLSPDEVLNMINVKCIKQTLASHGVTW